MTIDPDIRRLFSGISPAVRRTFQRGSLLPRIDPDLSATMREAWQRSYEIARETCLAAREQYERVYGRRGER